MLNARQFNDWIQALKSQHYSQAREELHPSPNCFCALGLLAEVVKDDFNLEWINRSNNTYWIQDEFSLNYGGYIPTKVLPKDLQRIVSFLNDEEELSFPEIAERLISLKKDFLSC